MPKLHGETSVGLIISPSTEIWTVLGHLLTSELVGSIVSMLLGCARSKQLHNRNVIASLSSAFHGQCLHCSFSLKDALLSAYSLAAASCRVPSSFGTDHQIPVMVFVNPATTF